MKIRFIRPANRRATFLQTIQVDTTNGVTKKYLLFPTKTIKTKYIILSESATENALRILGVTRVTTETRTICFDEQNLQLWWKEPTTDQYEVYDAMEVE